MQPFRVGVIGLGFIGMQHVDAIRRVPSVRIEAICDANAANLQAAGNTLGVSKTYTDWRDMLSDPAIDAIHNCTPHAMHDEINLAALNAGKHIYCEKPLSNTASGARLVCRVARDKGLAHGLNHQYRLNAPVQEMRARLLKGLAGRPLMAFGHYLQESGSQSTDWSHRMENTGIARAINDIGIHWIDTACCVLSQPVVSVMANLAVHYPVRTDAQGQEHPMDTEDTAMVLMRFADGTPGSLVISKAANGHKNDLFLAVECENYSMEWAQETPDRLVVGRKGTGFETMYMNPSVCQPETKVCITTPMGHVMGWPDALRNSVASFYASIADGSYQNPKQAYATFADGFLGMAFTEACLRSHRTGQWTEVELL